MRTWEVHEETGVCGIIRGCLFGKGLKAPEGEGLSCAPSALSC